MPIEVLMPALSPTMTEGTLSKWHVKAGDAVSSGQVIAEIETDKATMEVEAVEEGIVAGLLVAEGSEGVAVNRPIAVLAEEGETPEQALQKAAAAGAAASAPKNPPAQPVSTPAPAPVPSPASKAAAAPAAATGRIFASPLARRLAREAGLDLSRLSGSGPHGRIVRRDVENAPATPVAAASAASPALVSGGALDPAYELLPLNSMRKTIARRLTEAKQTIPHFYLSMDVEIDRLLEARKRLNAALQDAGEDVKLSVNDIIIKAAAVALMRVPQANAAWSEEGIRLYKRADISVAVAIEGGLITPVIRDAASLGLRAISAGMKSLAARARAGKLLPEDYQGGTFSISNLGMYGISSFQAVINPPQACILAVGAGVEKIVPRNGVPAVATVMTLTLSVDHRAVNGAVGAEYLQALKRILEAPELMML